MKKCISIILLFSIIFTVSLSAIPTDKLTSSGYFEKEATHQKIKSKSSFPVILVAVGAIAVAAILIFVMGKTKYDIEGTWSLTITHPEMQTPISMMATFGNGVASMGAGGAPGTYSVNDKSVRFTNEWRDGRYYDIYTYTGQFDDKDRMSGDMTIDNSITGKKTGFKWTAKKTN